MCVVEEEEETQAAQKQCRLMKVAAVCELPRDVISRMNIFCSLMTCLCPPSFLCVLLYE